MSNEPMKVYTIRLPEELIKQYEAKAFEQCVSVSELMRERLEKGLK